ncbi:MAG: nuclear transport factor 2 family protein [Chthoniobacterales bacterium]
MRAVEPRKPGPRSTPAERAPERRTYRRPTFDLSESNWITRTTIRSQESKWQNAIKDHDADALDKLLAENFEATSVNGGTASKARIVANVRADKNVYESAHASNMIVKMKTPGVAVVTGYATQKGTKESGEKFASTIQFVDTWKFRNGEWVCISSEANKVAKR